MPESLQSVLQQSVEEVLEKMFFIRSLGVMGDGAGVPESELVSSLAFEGQPSGCLTLRVSGGAARSVSADFLGVEEDELSSKQVGEVVCELANMICGSVLSRVESSATFRLAHPELLTVESRPGRLPEGSGESAVHSVMISGGSLVVAVRTEAGMPAAHCASLGCSGV